MQHLDPQPDPQPDAKPFYRHTCTKTGKALPFGRKAPEGQCPRCDELGAGAAPREAPHGIREAKAAAADDTRRAAEVKAHFASAKHRTECQPVCTFGDW